MFEFAKWALLVVMTVASALWLGRIAVATAIMVRERRTQAEQTLGYPRGTVRSFLALAMTFIVTIVVVFAGADRFGPDVAKWAMASYGAVIAFYFGSKVVKP